MAGVQVLRVLRLIFQPFIFRYWNVWPNEYISSLMLNRIQHSPTIGNNSTCPKRIYFRIWWGTFGTHPIIIELQHSALWRMLAGVICYPTGVLRICNAGCCIVWGTLPSSLSALRYFWSSMPWLSKWLSQCNLTLSRCELTVCVPGLV